mmetsp:Transcript_3621/g.5491  ORF Transcript_3621/g.5491 Transcript_3621/m.5491 type:complete len:433 (-) Transcript_3621:400-1698(-)|eukprot:CAMPEP_0184349992 /NCGR_PEP_ID=MMETSP1089-20130417/37403_1 /TAXON_ID=38269 ORGANISM="Gloeochaete wittrockiana, Strain SAG46.84" /NCGR_SAMPLE_ID=MMETSP1089 /ASSEMBLY_ACC=CAM_ASM_000445 /LENGTH=432 /DNA_ID=CAMNT_0026682529 /DNA_START=56 /DNA_END=1354 /DNA_ORIENTATION=+
MGSLGVLEDKDKDSSLECIKLEGEYGAHNYHPLPVVFSRAEGPFVWDPEGKRYFDFLSAYSAVNQGHCHPKLIQALVDQAHRCTLSSRAFYNDMLGKFAKYATQFFGFEMMLPMNTGAEAVETALKTARKWGYMKKGIPDGNAVIICCTNCFHGRTIAIISMSDDPSARDGFGPYLPGLVRIPYNDVGALEAALQKYGDRACGFLVEPIQGEAGVFVPDDGYLAASYKLCKQYNVLFIADEIQTGIARTGRMICCEWEGVHPDILILGKALSGGVYPVSCIMASKEILLCIRPGEHGSTYGGNPLACAVGLAALQVVKDENLTEKAAELGEWLRQQLRDLKCPYVEQVRGRGLLNAIVINPAFEKTAWEICLLLKSRGLLAKPTHDNIIRLAPPLVITKDQLKECVDIIRSVFEDVPKMSKEELDALDVHVH